MVLGGTVAHRARHHTRAVHEIEGFSAPLLALFFLFAGLQLEADALRGLGLVGLTYILARVLGRFLAARVGGAWLGASPPVRGRLGFCLLPQAGVALGLALLAANRLPDLGETLLPLVVAATVIFEIVGPVATRLMLRRASELPSGR